MSVNIRPFAWNEKNNNVAHLIRPEAEADGNGQRRQLQEALALARQRLLLDVDEPGLEPLLRCQASQHGDVVAGPVHQWSEVEALQPGGLQGKKMMAVGQKRKGGREKGQEVYGWRK